ncbi:MAG: IS1380 family transposase, partial [Clostridia bacterium]|nr:IS1380 family transposase [Clostridia bacterium]
QETVNQGKAPSKRIVSRKRIRTVIQNIIHFAGQLSKHARQLFLSISKSNAWADAFLGLVHRFAAC